MSTKAIDRVKAHYRQLSDEPATIRVPEWDDETGEFTVHFTPLTLYERQLLTRGKPTDQEMAVNVLILKAKDKDGAALFTKEDKQDLMRAAASSVIKRISQAIVDGSNMGEDEVAAAAGE